jgi:hypothetical protein
MVAAPLLHSLEEPGACLAAPVLLRARLYASLPDRPMPVEAQHRCASTGIGRSGNALRRTLRRPWRNEPHVLPLTQYVLACCSFTSCIAYCQVLPAGTSAPYLSLPNIHIHSRRRRAALGRTGMVRTSAVPVDPAERHRGDPAPRPTGRAWREGRPERSEGNAQTYCQDWRQAVLLPQDCTKK